MSSLRIPLLQRGLYTGWQPPGIDLRLVSTLLGLQVNLILPCGHTIAAISGESAESYFSLSIFTYPIHLNAFSMVQLEGME